MFRLSNLYSSLLKKTMNSDSGIAIEALNPEVAVLNRQILEDRISFFSINLITAGSATILYGGNRIELRRNNLFISAPGVKIYTESVNEEYSGLCLIVEEDVIYELPYAGTAISASYILANPDSDNKLTLNDSDFLKLKARIEDIQQYLHSSTPYKTECIYSLYAVFSLDLLYIESSMVELKSFSTSAFDLFVRFLKLIRENFTAHHEIEFYSDRLSVTSIYLSRIVKNISGLTVKNHVDRLLIMEAKYMLVRSELAVTEIGKKLGFATPAGFCKFFLRHQGVSPKEYRTTSRKENSDKQNSQT